MHLFPLVAGVSDLATLDTTDAQVAEALKKFGGELYDPGRGPR